MARDLLIRWIELERGIRQTEVDGITYRATYYPPVGTPGYWIVRDSVAGLDAYAPGASDNDWYCGSWASVRQSVSIIAAQRRTAAEVAAHG